MDRSEIAQYRGYWPLGTQERLTAEIALETTSRRADVTRIGPQHERPPTIDAPNGWLDLRHTKNNSDAFIPISDELRAAIDACPIEHLTYPAHPNRHAALAEGARRRFS